MTVPAAPLVEEVNVRQYAGGVKRAMRTISQALLTDDVSLYMSTPASADSFHHAVMQNYLDSGPQRFFQADDYGCCALVGELKRQDPGRACSEQQQQQQQGKGDSEGADSAVLAHARSGRDEALARLFSQPVLERILEEHGAALCVHFIGVHPQQQGRGLGSLMLRHLSVLADSAQQHLYLEASTARSQALYARHGFVHIVDKPLGAPGEEGAPVLKVMVRPPSSAALAEPAEAAAA